MFVMMVKGDEVEYIFLLKGVKEYFFDFNIGKMMKYSVKSFEKIIVKDGILLIEFIKRDKCEKEEIFFFIVKFNQCYLIYFKVEKLLEEEEEGLEEVKFEGVNNQSDIRYYNIILLKVLKEYSFFDVFLFYLQFKFWVDCWLLFGK